MGQCSADLFPALGQTWCCAQVPAERISTFGTALIWPHCSGKPGRDHMSGGRSEFSGLSQLGQIIIGLFPVPIPQLRPQALLNERARIAEALEVGPFDGRAVTVGHGGGETRSLQASVVPANRGSERPLGEEQSVRNSRTQASGLPPALPLRIFR
jgi:hypothetical protein